MNKMVSDNPEYCIASVLFKKDVVLGPILLLGQSSSGGKDAT